MSAIEQYIAQIRANSAPPQQQQAPGFSSMSLAQALMRRQQMSNAAQITGANAQAGMNYGNQVANWQLGDPVAQRPQGAGGFFGSIARGY